MKCSISRDLKSSLINRRSCVSSTSHIRQIKTQNKPVILSIRCHFHLVRFYTKVWYWTRADSLPQSSSCDQIISESSNLFIVLMLTLLFGVCPANSTKIHFGACILTESSCGCDHLFPLPLLKWQTHSSCTLLCVCNAGFEGFYWRGAFGESALQNGKLVQQSHVKVSKRRTRRKQQKQVMQHKCVSPCFLLLLFFSPERSTHSKLIWILSR